ncbi:MAG: choice-of-anchor V domain-containing protein [Bacteroidota bacterium]|nr:choice-of-anchor V domain-containing protein [Bacteroidota bacterium]
MKLKITSFLAISFIASFILMSHHNGVAEAQNKDRTGAPGSVQPCTHCHSPIGGANTLSNINVLDASGNEVSEYIPGENYSITFVVTDANAAAYGFQATAVHGDGSNAGTFSNPGTNVQIEDVDGRHIVEQSDPLVSGVFTADWTAPSAGSGDVGFYMAGLAVNLAYGNSGDSHHETALSISEASVERIEELDLVQIPFATSEGIVWKAHANGILNVYSIDGRLNYSSTCSAGNDVNIPLSSSLSGLQLVQFTPEGLDYNSQKTWKVVLPN